MSRLPQPPQPYPFTETQIRERAYQLWQANPEGSAEAHWEGALEALRRERSLFGRMGKSWQTAFSTEHRGFTLDAIKTWISALGLLATVTAGVGLYLNYQQGQEKLVTDRFAKAVEQLGSKEPDVRIGAVYSLERIARDSPRDHGAIMEVLTAFVRNRSQLPKDWTKGSGQELPKVTTDVQSALTVIGRREVKNDQLGQWLDLSQTNLQCAALFRANLTFADLQGANLSEANLGGADLQGVVLNRVKLQGAKLQGANLSNAFLRGAYLEGADGLTTDQIKQGLDWQYAQYDPATRQQLGLPPEKP